LKAGSHELKVYFAFVLIDAITKTQFTAWKYSLIWFNKRVKIQPFPVKKHNIINQM